MTGVKICGLCRPVDAAVAASAGATHAGVILGAGGPRERASRDAAAIYEAAPGLVRVGVFADRPVEWIVEMASELVLDIVQLHGSEDVGTVGMISAAGPWQVWKAVWPRTGEALRAARGLWQGTAHGLLVDGSAGAARGGTGTRAPWRALAPRWAGVPTFVLAGGLNAGNVDEAIGVLDPDIVDVSSGVESVPGIKDAGAVRAFVRAALAALQGSPAEGRG